MKLMADRLNWTTTKAERELISRVVERGHKLKLTRDNYDPMTLRMDVTAVHLNCMKLDFDKLLAFPDFDFVHDIFGIARHIDRENAQLRDCFVPRCAAR